MLSILCAFISWSFSWFFTALSSVSSLCTCSRLALLLTKLCSSSRFSSLTVSSSGALLKRERQHTHFTVISTKKVSFFWKGALILSLFNWLTMLSCMTEYMINESTALREGKKYDTRSTLNRMLVLLTGTLECSSFLCSNFSQWDVAKNHYGCLILIPHQVGLHFHTS